MVRGTSSSSTPTRSRTVRTYPTIAMRLNTNEMAMVDVALPILPACTPTVPPIETTSSPLSSGPRRNAGRNQRDAGRPDEHRRRRDRRAEDDVAPPRITIGRARAVEDDHGRKLREREDAFGHHR